MLSLQEIVMGIGSIRLTCICVHSAAREAGDGDA
jgi:hypothetical protein